MSVRHQGFQHLVDTGGVFSDPFKAAFGKEIRSGSPHLKEAVFEGGRTEVGDEDFHAGDSNPGGCGDLSDPGTEFTEVVVGAWDYLHRYDFTDLSGGFSAGFDSSFYSGDITRKETSYQSRADFFPAGHGHIRSLEGSVCSFHKADQAFAFDHSYCLFSHNIFLLNSVLIAL
jgi:hypothetical protein